MDKKLFGNKIIELEGNTYLRAVLCADGFYRWSVTSFNEIREDTPAFISHKDLDVLETATDKSENPEFYEENI